MRLQKREAWIPLAVVLCPGPAACGLTTQHAVGFSTFRRTRVGKLSSRAGGKAIWGGKILVCRNWKLHCSLGFQMLLNSWDQRHFFRNPVTVSYGEGLRSLANIQQGVRTNLVLCKYRSSPSGALWVMLSPVCGDTVEESTPSRLKHWQPLQIPINHVSFLLTSGFI